jgi:hypothetical protein
LRETRVTGYSAALCTGLLAAGAYALPLAGQTVASASVVPIQVTGVLEARFSMVILGDGYTAAELPKFREQVDRHLNILWAWGSSPYDLPGIPRLCAGDKPVFFNV